MYITALDIEIYMLIFLLPLILINWIRNLKRLAPFSTVANGVTVVSFGIILYYIIMDNPTLEEKEPIGQLKHLPLFLGTVLFALEAIGVVRNLIYHYAQVCGIIYYYLKVFYKKTHQVLMRVLLIHIKKLQFNQKG